MADQMFDLRMLDGEAPTGPAKFEWYDYLLFALILAISTAIGLYYGLAGKQKSTKEYLSANRSLGVLPSLLSIYMSQTSGVAVVGHPAEMYTYGIQSLWIVLGNTLGYLVAALIFVPMFYPMKLTSSLEYLELRFRSKSVRIIATILTIISGILYLGLCLFLPGIALESVTPIPMWASFLAVGVLGTIYTSLGGLKAVVWTDVFQALTSFIGLVAIVILAIKTVGTFGDVWEINQAGGRIYTSFDPNPITRMSFWSVVVGNFAAALFVTGAHPATVQRVCAMKSLKEAYIATIGVIPLQYLLYFLVFTCGGAAFAYYESIGCDPLRTGAITNVNQLLPYFISDGIRTPAIPGLFVAILFSAGISSVTSVMNYLAAVTWTDFMADTPYFSKLPEPRKALVTKMLAFFYGCCGIGMGFAYQYIPGNAITASQCINSAAISPVLGAFLLGALFPFTNWIGTVVGMILGFAMNMTLGMGNSLYQPYALSMNTSTFGCPENITISDSSITGNEENTPAFFRMSHVYYSGAGTLTTVIVGILVSLVTGIDKPSEQDPRYFAPFFDRLFCCLPASWRKHLWCGVPRDAVTDAEEKDDISSSSSSSRDSGFNKEKMSLEVPPPTIEEKMPYDDHWGDTKLNHNGSLGHTNLAYSQEEWSKL